MSQRWAALVDLPPDKHERVAAIVGQLGVRVVAVRWDQCGGGDLPAEPASVIVAAAQDCLENRAGLERLQEGTAPAATVLLAPRSLTAETLQAQLECRALNVIPEARWMEPRCIERAFRGILFPEQLFDLAALAAPNAAVERFDVSTLAEKHLIADEAAKLVRCYTSTQKQVRNIHLIINELINNAFFHSFRAAGGQEKYSPRDFSRLAEGERVVLEMALSKEAIVLAVEDNSGTLSPQEVLRYLLRQTAGEGLYDSHGRGFYLVSSLVDNLSICLVPGRRARIAALVYPNSKVLTPMLNIFVAPPPPPENP